MRQYKNYKDKLVVPTAMEFSGFNKWSHKCEMRHGESGICCNSPLCLRPRRVWPVRGHLPLSLTRLDAPPRGEMRPSEEWGDSDRRSRICNQFKHQARAHLTFYYAKVVLSCTCSMSCTHVRLLTHVQLWSWCEILLDLMHLQDCNRMHWASEKQISYFVT